MNFQHAVITGASSGIGLALAELMAAEKTSLLLVARRIDRLQELATRLEKQHAVKCFVLAADLARGGEAKRVREWCEQNSFPVDCLVNNAGIGTWGPFTDQNLAGQLATIDLNVRSLTELCGEFYPLLKMRPSAVLNVASTAAFQAIPTFSAYAATKSYVLSFSRALHHEWHEHGIVVTALCPGPTKTEFMQHAQISHLDKLAQKFEFSAEQVAAVGLAGIKSGKIEVIPGWLNWLGSKLAQFSPRVLTEMISGKFFH